MQGTMQTPFSLQFHTATSDSDVGMDGSPFNRPGGEVTAQISQAQKSRAAVQCGDCRKSIDPMVPGLRPEMRELVRRYRQDKSDGENPLTRPDIDFEEMLRSLPEFTDIMGFTKELVLRNRGIEEPRDANVLCGAWAWLDEEAKTLLALDTERIKRLYLISFMEQVGFFFESEPCGAGIDVRMWQHENEREEEATRYVDAFLTSDWYLLNRIRQGDGGDHEKKQRAI